MRPVLPTNHPLNTRSSDRPDSLRPTLTLAEIALVRGSASKAIGASVVVTRAGLQPRVNDVRLLVPAPSTPSLIGLSHSGSVMSISSQSCSLAGPSIDAHSDLIHDDVSLPVTDLADNQENQSTVPQLIMPSLMVPRRRPFSEVGIGKTSLIKTLAERCEHIVHMDPIENRSAVHATETYASSRPQPWWRSDSELTVTTRRRISTTGDVLDRNVCFVESPGHRRDACGSWRDLHYVESHLTSLMNKPMADSDLFTLVNSGGEPVVDALLYLIPHSGLVREDVEYIKRAQRMTNVIPVLTRVDELAPEEIKHIKQQVVKSLADKDVDYFSFEGPDDSEEIKCVYAVSTESWPDYDTMDASTLMDSEYIPPLLPTDLGRLVDHIFSLDGSARLRHSAAVKCIKWRRDHGDNLLQNALSSGALVSRSIPERAMRLRSFRRTPSWDRLELYNWANNLRQSLQSERLYHLMEERAISNAVATQSSLVHVPRNGKKKTQSKKRKAPQPTHQDPLGLLEMGGGLKQKGMLALEMVSSVGLVGLVASKIMHTGWSDGMCSVVASRRRNMEVGRLSMVLSF
ncbi:hypothetical protein FOXB_16058 [Fusarium oxysporum f. sp. conglutinans Fo5176]|uniref:Septin-type G domain-containing protein n=1 Tax=Fusarium oxysporum (strain Fo5176) TaxID=660025 RepID=F9GBM5_FUSOF|nr:hypothetical protein FOXB_16058 [Fusarium oxysporum f. sp. conglutinans Fo5176]